MKKYMKKIFGVLMALMMIIPANMSAAFAASCTAVINFGVIPVYLDTTKNLGYDVDYDNYWNGTIDCTYSSSHATNANHQIPIKNFHPDNVLRGKIRSGYEWKGWIKYTQNLNSNNVKNPPAGTYYSWKNDTTSVSGTGTHYIYMVYHAKEPVKQTLTLSYNANGGSGAPAQQSQQVNQGSSAAFTVSSTAPVRSGYQFLGWSTNASATSASYTPGSSITISSNTTLYAVWQKNPEPVKTYTVRYTDGVEDETVFADQIYADLVENSETPAFAGVPTREGYVFEGWAPEVSALVTGDAVYVAQWKKADKKESIPSMDKKILDAAGNELDTSSLKPGETADFRLISNVPGNLFKYVNFEQGADQDKPSMSLENPYVLTLHDAFDETFTLNKESIVVKIGERVLINTETETLYTYVENKEGCASADAQCSFHIELNLNDLYNKGVINDEDVRNATQITVDYNMTLSDNATVKAHQNRAWVTSKEPTFTTDIVDVDVYGIKAVKIDAADPEKKLAGAEFTLYAADKETVLGTATTGEDGLIQFDGLKAGTYWLLETKAPEGYIRSTEMIEITVNDDTALSANYVERSIANSNAPHTGGAGTMMYTAGGIALLAGALVIAVTKKKKSESEQ